MRNDRDVEKFVAQLGLKSGSRQAVVQYGRGLLDGMRMAYVAVARKLYSLGKTDQDIRQVLSDVTDVKELQEILTEARGE